MAYRPKLFVGIDLDPRTRARCGEISSRLESQGLRARFEAPEKFHITLAFLGWVDAVRVESIRSALHAASASAVPFTLTLDRLGAFPHERNPHVVWVGARSQGEAFTRLARATRTEYGALGFAFDKDAVAHVTLARIKEHHAHLPLLEVKPIRLNIRELTLFESLPAGRTTRYEVRERSPLGRGAGYSSAT
jgi:RNA 2',3'-cyclic 3'-phosphodiesterase